MAINVYTGLQGSGKTYEVVGFVVLPALVKGRRVVTNIEGLDYEKIQAYCDIHHPEAQLGELLLVSNDQVSQPGFWPEKDGDESIVKGGDLVCIDEAWRFFGTDIKIKPGTRIFLREHRHYTHPDTGVTCDLALMMQSITDLHRNVKSVIELSFRTHKLKTVGLNERYRLDMFEGTNQRISLRANTWQKAYDSQIFALYKSYAAGAGKEMAIDTRQNIMRDPRNWAMAGGVLLMACIGIWGLLHVYGKYKGKPEGQELAADAARPAGAPAAPGAKPAAPAAPALPPKPTDSTDWRLAGRIVTPRGERAVMVGAGAKLRVEDPAMFVGYGWDRRAQLDGERVSAWSGPAIVGAAAAPESKSAMSIGK